MHLNCRGAADAVLLREKSRDYVNAALHLLDMKNGWIVGFDGDRPYCGLTIVGHQSLSLGCAVRASPWLGSVERDASAELIRVCPPSDSSASAAWKSLTLPVPFLFTIFISRSVSHIQPLRSFLNFSALFSTTSPKLSTDDSLGADMPHQTGSDVTLYQKSS